MIDLTLARPAGVALPQGPFGVHLPPEALHLFDTATGARIAARARPIPHLQDDPRHKRIEAPA